MAGLRPGIARVCWIAKHCIFTRVQVDAQMAAAADLYRPDGHRPAASLRIQPGNDSQSLERQVRVHRLNVRKPTRNELRVSARRHNLDSLATELFGFDPRQYFANQAPISVDRASHHRIASRLSDRTLRLFQRE